MTEQAASSGGSARHGAGRIAWQLLLTLWVGAVWSLHFILLPGLQHMGLVEDVDAFAALIEKFLKEQTP